MRRATAVADVSQPPSADAAAVDRRRVDASTGRPPTPPTRRGSLVAMGAAFAGYLAVAVALWWHVWTSDPAKVTTCGCGDASLFLWFLEWPAYALSHGHNPLYSSALFHPAGTNLLSNTSVLAVGIPLSPVTLLFGPVASLNVASTLGPALSALAMFWLLRRWVRWAPAAFVGGLLYGFSPFVFVNLAGAHLMLGVLVFPPLIVACCDELLVRQRRRPYVVGGVLGLLGVVQFFLSTEVLAIVALSTVIGLVVLVGYAAVREPEQLGRRTAYAARGFGAAAVVMGALLAYPLWFVFAGPAHLSGPIWPTLRSRAGGIALANVFFPALQTELRRGMLDFGGYLGPALPEPEYLGLGAVVVVAGGLLAWRRDRRLWFFGTMAVIAVVLSLGLAVPWRVLSSVPVVQNVLPSRFAMVTTLCVAVMVAVVVDRTRQATRRFTRSTRRRRRSRRSVADALSSSLAALGALGVAAVAIVPMAGAIASNVPFTVERVVLPTWFSRVAPHLAPDQVVLAYPAPFTLVQSAMAWQAVDRVPFAMVGGGGPGGILARAGKERPGQAVVSALSFSFVGTSPTSASNVADVRAALEGWGVTIVVVPDPAGLAPYEHGTHPAATLGVFTAAIGRRPSYRADAWVWSDVEHPGAPLMVPPGAIARCAATGVADGAPREAIPDCVIAAAGADRARSS